MNPKKNPARIIIFMAFELMFTTGTNINIIHHIGRPSPSAHRLEPRVRAVMALHDEGDHHRAVDA